MARTDPDATDVDAAGGAPTRQVGLALDSAYLGATLLDVRLLDAGRVGLSGARRIEAQRPWRWSIPVSKRVTHASSIISRMKPVK
jgi:hypothetical protein